MHRQLDLLLKEAKAHGMITTVTPGNGLLYPKQAEKLRGLIDMLHFSLDSPDRDEHDKSRGGQMLRQGDGVLLKSPNLLASGSTLFSLFLKTMSARSVSYGKRFACRIIWY
ncbi:hypothetical protein PEC18_39615 [Paucibacter sp. O1-1]|nr:hypothetical protein [Paucibacter sp. O1-1]MDA3831719.1 hypothetical protein [Paucibacter sp. O1-1]